VVGGLCRVLPIGAASCSGPFCTVLLGSRPVLQGSGLTGDLVVAEGRSEQVDEGLEDLLAGLQLAAQGHAEHTEAVVEAGAATAGHAARLVALQADSGDRRLVAEAERALPGRLGAQGPGPSRVRAWASSACSRIRARRATASSSTAASEGVGGAGAGAPRGGAACSPASGDM
jgi:hypothetical protein